jgi:hypothetical protein
VKGEKLHVPGGKNKPLNAVCGFFNAWKKSGKLTGNPETDAQLIEPHYAQTKNTLSAGQQKNLPKCEDIVTAIRAANNRREAGTEFEEGTELLKSFLGRENKPLGNDVYSALYSALYWGKIVENKDLHVPWKKNSSLNAVCGFFNAWKKSGKLTGNPETDAQLIEPHYAQTKSTLSADQQDRLPNCKSIVTAIQAANNRHEAGTELLKSFLGRKNAQSESIYEKEVVKVEEPEALFYEEEPSSVKIKQEPLDQPGYILKKEAELDQIQ